MADHPAVEFLAAVWARAEETARAAGGGEWALAKDWETVAIYDSECQPVVYDEGWPSEAQKVHIALHDPASVLRRVAAERALLADLQAERHLVVDGDGWYSCGAATEERDGDHCYDDTRRGPCDCGRDARVERRVRLMAEGWGWEEKP